MPKLFSEYFLFGSRVGYMGMAIVDKGAGYVCAGVRQIGFEASTGCDILVIMFPDSSLDSFGCWCMYVYIDIF